ncbi:MAG: hypothetical protein EA340_07705 [Nitriliruptor sp.]|nr:MAG: hypothetical protein EA340_07705 [Nitriliruptor sp.]
MAAGSRGACTVTARDPLPTASLHGMWHGSFPERPSEVRMDAIPQLVGRAPTPDTYVQPTRPDHLVTFYEDATFLAASVRGFLLEGLRSGETVVVVAIPEHRAAFEAALTAAGHDVASSRRTGHYIELDAASTLTRLVVDGALQADRFEEEVSRFVAASAAAADGLRIYGEMVALLWQDGAHALALELEDHWNALLDQVAFPLWCGYPLTAFDTPETTARFHDVCARHTIVTTDSYSSLAVTDPLTDGVVLLGAHEPGGCPN